MEYTEFVSAVEAEMNIRLGGGMSAEASSVLKNNGKRKQGITVTKQGCNASPTIYLEDFYDSYQNGASIGNITEEILRFYRTLEPEKTPDLNYVAVYDRVKRKIVPKLISRDQNQELLEEVPFVPWMDLAVVFYVLLDVTETGTATMLVRHRHMKDWGVTKQDVYEDAMKNAGVLLPAELIPVSRVIQELMGERVKTCNLLEKAGYEGEEEMYVLTNRLRSFGAVCITYPGVTEKIAEVLKESYYILPSSIHEVIIAPENRGFALEMDALREMICEINETQVQEEEVLSGHAYFYDRKKGELSL